MTLSRYILWGLCTVLGGCIVYGIQIPIRKKGNIILSAIFTVIEVMLIIYLAYCLISIASPFLWKWGYVLAGIYFGLLGDVFAKLISLVVKKDQRKKHFRWILPVTTAAFLLYATINMEIITPKHWTYTSSKLKNEYTVVFVSDMHYGSSQSESVTKNALYKIKELNPDYLLLGGDITDEHTTKEEMIDIYKTIGSLGIPTYYIYGNHDRQERGDYLGGALYTPQELEEAITGSGITILYNEVAQVEDDLVFIGMEDPSHPDKRAKVSDLPERPADAYVICLDHTPYQNDDIREMNADLQLSGHTHAGQIFPMRTAYALIGLNVVGEYQFDDTTLLVSPGITGWYLPLRNESHCNYEVIDLKPE